MDKKFKIELDFYDGEPSCNGFSCDAIADEWLKENGGMPQGKNRNHQFWRVANAMRHICFYDAGLMVKYLPDYGLTPEEKRKIVDDVLARPKVCDIPRSVKYAIHSLELEANMAEIEDEIEQSYRPAQALRHLLGSEKCIDSSLLPPVFKEYVEIMPDKFKTPTVMALLPMLGTVGSKLRATYRDGHIQSPSFQVEIEAPMASGKSFVHRIYEGVMAKVAEVDKVNREKEAAYRDKVRMAKNAEKQPETESYVIRLIPPTTSVGMVLQRVVNAKGAHLLMFTDEMKIVIDAMRRGSFGDLRALMRNAFDNAEFGMDYKSDMSTNAVADIYINSLHCGTQRVYSQYYNDSEDGTVTRVIFCNLEQKIGQEMPIIRKMSATACKRVDKALDRLNAVTMDGDEVRKETTYLHDYNFMNRWSKRWCKGKSALARKYQNREVDRYLRRAAVVGFRAGMLAWFLWDCKPDKETKKKVEKFSEWIAEYMLWKLCTRIFPDEMEREEKVPFVDVWDQLDIEFTTDDVEKAALDSFYTTDKYNMIRKWKEHRMIEQVIPKHYRKIKYL